MEKLLKLANLIRYLILISSSKAGSGHPTSSLSATDLMTVLFFAKFLRFDPKRVGYLNNDRLIFSKGHASPLFYSLWVAAGVLKEEELMTVRQFGSRLEGHPTMEFPFTESPTGSLGQGLSIGVGEAINAKYLDKLPYKTFVLLGDSETAEGSVWEAIQIASFYKLDNLIGIIDVNRLGQRGQTMYGHDLRKYQKMISGFGWETIVIDGHSIPQITRAYTRALKVKNRPVMIIAKTIKGKGVSFLENKDNWHGKALKPDELEKALSELGKINYNLRGKISLPRRLLTTRLKVKLPVPISYPPDQMVATRKAYGNALARLYPAFPDMVVLDAEVSNSTYADIFKDKFPSRFFEMFIAEQNMVGVAMGLATRGKIPFISTFAAFFSRAFDQIRMTQYAHSNVKFVGSHAGVSIGEDGSSQMGLEDIGMFRSVLGSVVLYPSDAISTEKLVEQSLKFVGPVYLRTTRKETTLLYKPTEQFPIGGSKVLKKSTDDKVTVIGAGVTLFEALAAWELLRKENINIRVIDLYSIKPLDLKTLQKAVSETKAIITVEDHHLEGGLGEAVASALSPFGAKIHALAVTKMPHSGKPSELLDYENISSSAIIKLVKQLL